MNLRFLFFAPLLTFTVHVIGQVKTIRLSNPSLVERKDELVVLKRDLLVKKLGNFSRTDYVTVQMKNTPLVVQYDDLDSDGYWDEAVLLHDFKSKETVSFTIRISKSPAAVKAVVRSYVRQKHKLPDNSFGDLVLRDTMPFNNQPTDFSKQKLPPYLTEGPAWENDKVGFRKYFDTRNANDIWGKRVPEMVLDEVGVHPETSYHHLSDWGMDILKVGKSLGAGALALQVKTNGYDTLVRLGTNVRQEIYQQVCSGPVRSVFKIIYKDWQYLPDVDPITVTEEISIWGGQYFFQNNVEFNNAPPGSSLVTGTIDFYSKKYEKIIRGGITGLYTYDQQSENKDLLGLAVLIPAANFSAFEHVNAANTDVTNVFAVKMKLKNKQPVVYRYYVGWQLTNPVFGTRQGFAKMINTEAIKFGQPLIIQ